LEVATPNVQEPALPAIEHLVVTEHALEVTKPDRVDPETQGAELANVIVPPRVA
jgi:hypothetical protein